MYVYSVCMRLYVCVCVCVWVLCVCVCACLCVYVRVCVGRFSIVTFLNDTKAPSFVKTFTHVGFNGGAATHTHTRTHTNTHAHTRTRRHSLCNVCRLGPYSRTSITAPY